MKPGIALLMTVALLALSSALTTATDLPITWAMIVACAGWAAYDSRIINLRRYKSGISYHPLVLFACVVGIWLIAFPWYLIVRNRIVTGHAQLKAVKQEPDSQVQAP